MSILLFNCQTMITTNIGDYKTCSIVKIIYLLIYLIDRKHVYYQLSKLISILYLRAVEFHNHQFCAIID